MGIKVENSFLVPAPREDAWRVLVDLQRVVPCMPGTELTELVDERHFRATVRLKVGPVDLLFSGEGELYDMDAAAGTAKLRAKGRETKGRGAFQTELALKLTQQGAATLVQVDTDLTLSGSVAQYGRGVGLVREITSQCAEAFARNLTALVAREQGGAGAAAAADDTTRAPESTAPISGLALLFSAIKAIFARWLGGKATPR